jgi:uncharacterized protein involved in exopolysaccharide biosynthesis
MPRHRNDARSPRLQRPERAGTSMPRVLRAMGAGLMGGFGGIFIALLCPKSDRPRNTSDRCEP